MLIGSRDDAGNGALCLHNSRTENFYVCIHVERGGRFSKCNEQKMAYKECEF